MEMRRERTRLDPLPSFISVNEIIEEIEIQQEIEQEVEDVPHVDLVSKVLAELTDSNPVLPPPDSRDGIDEPEDFFDIEEDNENTIVATNQEKKKRKYRKTKQSYEDKKLKIQANVELSKKLKAEFNLSIENNEDFFGKCGKKYNVIVIDPPWSYGHCGVIGRAMLHYPTMDDEDIYKLPLYQLCDNDCIVLMWTTGPKKQVAFEAIKKWGLNYKSEFVVWIKVTETGKVVSVFGYRTRSATESVLCATRGRDLKFKEGSVHQLLYAKRREHSRKPDEFFELLKTYFGSNYDKINKIEIFAREKRDGWDTWGNQVDFFRQEENEPEQTADDILSTPIN